MKFDQFKLHADIEDRHWWFVGRRKIMREVVRRVVMPSKAATVVDVGCGTGANIAALAEDYSCIGIDSSAEAITFARARFSDIRFVLGSAPADLANIMHQVRLLLLMDVLEHMADDFGFFSELLAATIPGTYFLVTVPADMALWSEHDVSFGHFRRYDLEGLERLWTGLPVTAGLLSYYNARLYPIAKVMRVLSRLRGRAWGAAGTDFTMPIWPLNTVLQAILTSEAKVLCDVLEGKRPRAFTRGVSLVALLRRERGQVVRGGKPSQTPGV